MTKTDAAKRIAELIYWETESLLTDSGVDKAVCDRLAWEILQELTSGLDVVVEVSGGVAEVVVCPPSVRVQIIDHDNEKHA